MTLKNSEQLRNLETLRKSIEACETTNEIERETRQLLLELIRARRTELRREQIKPRIRARKRGGIRLEAVR